MELSKKDKSKILVKHLERAFELVSRCGETYVIMSIMDALSEIESLEVEDDEYPNGRGGSIVERRILEIAASSLIKMRNNFKDPNVVINEITFEVEGHRFYAEKFPNLDEFSLRTENGEVVRLASDGTLCRNYGRCLSGCGYCL